jgi:predicted ATP-dependent endonuclease of OLD family
MGFSFSDKSAIATSAGMYKDFLTDFDRINSNFFETKNDEFLKTRIFDCIDGDIIQQDDDIYYEQKNNISIPLSAVASSIKELSPLVIALTKVDPKQLSIMFEEPEAHLHPSLQVDVAKVISYLVNKGSFIQVTTHSDIFLSQINNLLRISKLRKQNQTYFEKLLSDFDLPESLVLDDVNVSAYFFEKDENGLTRATLQDLKDGIPFDTFKKTYSKLYEESNLIDEYLLKLAK